MNKTINFFGYIALISMVLLFGFKVCQNTSKNADSFEKSSATSDKPVLLTLLFQPALEERSEVIIDFDKNILTFRSIYSFLPEPPPPPKENGEIVRYESKRKEIQPFTAEITNQEKGDLQQLISEFTDNDYKAIEGMEIDGTTYNFSVLFESRIFNNGFIANSKTENQQRLIGKVLDILDSKTLPEENLSILNYYNRNY